MAERTCASFEAAIAEWPDGTLAPDEARRLETHLAECPRCRALADDLSSITRVARTLESPTPPPGVWPRLAHQLGVRVDTPDSAARAAPRRGIFDLGWGARAALAAAASLVMAFTWWLARDTASDPTPPAPSARTEPAERGPDFGAVTAVEAVVRVTERHYADAVATVAPDTTGSGFDAALAATFEENLAVIDMAIAESRAALREVPDSQLAEDHLLEGLRSKAALLQDAIALVNDMRLGE